MRKEYICKCNQCEEFFIDENPSLTQEKVEIPNMLKLDSLIYNEEYKTWECPTCNSDTWLNSIEEYE